MPMKRKDVVKITEEALLDHQIAEWAFNSHNWIEQDGFGTFYCQWCSRYHRQNHIDKNYPLCRENPAIKNTMEKFIEEFLPRR